MSPLPSLPCRLRGLAIVIVVSAVPLLAGCPKKDTPAVVDAAPPPPPVEDAAPLVLIPVGDEDAGTDAGADAGPKKWTGSGTSTNVLRLKQCCNALGAEAKKMGASPEAGLLVQAAAQCNAMAGQVGASGTAPELGVLRTLMAGRSIPAVCAGF
jgi:hypothetical protein